MIEAEDLVSQITSCGYNPDVITYNSLISGYSNVVNVQKCLSLYENLKKLSIKPTLNTYHPLISACSEEDMLLADYLFYEMLGMGFSPDGVVYNAIIHSYAKYGDVQILQKAFALHREGHCERKDFTGAYVWYRDMADNGFLLNACTCNKLTAGLRREGRLREAQIVCSEMKVKLMDDWSTADDLSAVAK
ncbi:hypothetical protein CMV_019672 [Castanea mollissima]|uniref:Pentatricopeptide repeat-containing protein n=1 Tax=Castanea mollissima TaxID=60419 RepID=A0A8J4VGG9_9ROSI|nr:hypothetical protein CMV_019672 [Castanea mollissima]